jgi:hypothetical protein
MRTASVLLLLLFAAGPIAAQSVPDPAGPDFLFGRPDGSIALRGSWVLPRAGSDLYAFIERELTVEDGDFNTVAFATDFGMTVTPRTDIVIGLEYSRASVASEYRNFVDNNRLPIEQTTRLTEANVSGSVRFALAPRGRDVSRFAWVPSRVVPYAGVGAGMLWYEFQQSGDFIDALDQRRPVFAAALQSRGWTPSAHVLGGVDVQLYRRWYLTLDGRYLWAAADLDSDFERFEPIDLAGFRFGAGVNLVF